MGGGGRLRANYPIKVSGLGLARMLGVHDLMFAAWRVGGSASNMSLAEMDMDDMFWQMPEDEGIESVDWIFSVLNGSFQSLHKKPN